MESTFDAGVKQYNLDKSYINLESMFARKKLQMQVGVSRPLPLKNGSPLLVTWCGSGGRGRRFEDEEHTQAPRPAKASKHAGLLLTLGVCAAAIKGADVAPLDGEPRGLSRACTPAMGAAPAPTAMPCRVPDRSRRKLRRPHHARTRHCAAKTKRKGEDAWL